MKPLLVGEDNPRSLDPQFDLYPVPEGCAGWRLCCLILGMWRKDYLASFDRVNLCTGRWRRDQAWQAAGKILLGGSRKIVLCGAKAREAFGLAPMPFFWVSADGSSLLLPHPSGRNLLWNKPGVIQRARATVAEFLPGVGPMLGKYDHLTGMEGSAL